MTELMEYVTISSQLSVTSFSYEPHRTREPSCENAKDSIPVGQLRAAPTPGFDVFRKYISPSPAAAMTCLPLGENATAKTVAWHVSAETITAPAPVCVSQTRTVPLEDPEMTRMPLG